MALRGECLVRSAEMRDRDQLAHLIFDDRSTAHRHLDWRTPLEWIGFPPYFIIEQKGKIEAVLACPVDPPTVAWVRVFACTDSALLQDNWTILWQHVYNFFEAEKEIRVSVITLQDWFQVILEKSKFHTRQQIVSLTWTGVEFPKEKSLYGIELRLMTETDIPRVAEVDAAAFDRLWQNTEQALQKAFDQASLVTVVELEGEIVGYQLSTTNIIGGHLARLAVLPELQGKGIGKFLLTDMIHQFTHRGIHTISVNTQNDNTSSLSLYKSIGFIETGERYPVYEFEINEPITNNCK
jgi:ribosomal protein S18 acetylase RimI-like enzyme